MYGSKTGVYTQKHSRRSQAAEMRILQKKIYIVFQVRENEDIRVKMNVCCTEGRMKEYKINLVMSAYCRNGGSSSHVK